MKMKMHDGKKEELLKRVYPSLPPLKQLSNEIALLVTDMQYLDAARGHGMFLKAKELGIEEVMEYYGNRLDLTVVPNIRKLLDIFRERGLNVLYSKIASLTADGNDRGRMHRLLGLYAHKDSKEAQILEEVKPTGDEIVITKTSSGVFGTTSIDQLLRNLDIKTLVITGVLTNECVENAARAAADLGYDVIVPEDAAAAVTPELHHASLYTLGHTYAYVMSTQELSERIQSMLP